MHIYPEENMFDGDLLIWEAFVQVLASVTSLFESSASCSHTTYAFIITCEPRTPKHSVTYIPNSQTGT